MRPQPGADATAARAAALGLDTLVAPIFAVRPIAWEAPAAGRFDALLLTSANAARHAGPALSAYRGLRCYCVGEATEAAARAAGLSELRTGSYNGEAVVALAAADGVRALLHLAGREHQALGHTALRIERRVVYASDPLDLSAVALTALQEAAMSRHPRESGDPASSTAEGQRDSRVRGNDGGCDVIVMLHSPAAARHFGALADEHDLARAPITLLAISDAAARAAGAGWRTVQVAATPRDGALLALAASLCQTDVSAAGTGLGE